MAGHLPPDVIVMDPEIKASLGVHSRCVQCFVLRPGPYADRCSKRNRDVETDG